MYLSRDESTGHNPTEGGLEMAENDIVVNNATTAVVERLPFHILFTKRLTIWANWREWRADWSECQNTRQLIGLLHDGFTVSMEMSQYGYDSEGRYHSDLPVYDDIDRLILYFTVAEGWRDSDLLRKPGDRDEKYRLGYNKEGRSIDKNIVELRQMVATKAFDMLCSNLFNENLPEHVHFDEDFPMVWYGVTSERLLQHVMSFFRVQERYSHLPGEYLIMPNLRHPGYLSGVSNGEKVATEFLLNLARFIWCWSPRQAPYFGMKDDDKRQAWEASVKTMRDRLDAAKPWVIEVLNYLGHLNLLREWLLELDQVCLAKLKEIAFRKESSNNKCDGLVKTIDEACYLGSKAAWLLKEYETKKQVHDHLSKIREAKRKMEEAKQNLVELSGKKK